ncbi:MAG: hypothetical protein A2W29_03985 [Gemmatimonadetes bacterium RBG_16_66_8]|nr:MAG: hypothetical protein A2W29_03985 [Gemmatimonadetes bacterium RBG_16_66_8]
MSGSHGVTFPNESADYRAARHKLLDAEARLREQTEEVACLRRELPLGGVVKSDYVFEEGGRNLADNQTTKLVRLSELFQDEKDSLIIYSFMYGPAMNAPCPMCTSLLDGLNGNALHIRQRVNFAVVAESPLKRIRPFARERGWGNLRLLSSASNTYTADYHGQTPDGAQMPMLNVFTRRGGQIHHFYGTELLYAPFPEGMDARHVDSVWPLWNMLDFTPEGRGTVWYPELRYG